MCEKIFPNKNLDPLLMWFAFPRKVFGRKKMKMKIELEIMNDD